MEVSGQLHAPAALLQGEEPSVPIGYEARWPLEPVWTTWREDKSFPYWGSKSDSSAVGRPARSQSLHRMHYPGSSSHNYNMNLILL
jgi:hypothetical protein